MDHRPYLRTLPRRLERADTVIWLHLPTDVCLQSAINRIGKPRVDLPGQEDQLDSEFAKYILNFESDQIPRMQSLLEGFKGKLIVFTSREEVNAWLKKKQLTLCDMLPL